MWTDRYADGSCLAFHSFLKSAFGRKISREAIACEATQSCPKCSIRVFCQFNINLKHKYHLEGNTSKEKRDHLFWTKAKWVFDIIWWHAYLWGLKKLMLCEVHIFQRFYLIFEKILEAGVTNEWLKGRQKVANNNLPLSLYIPAPQSRSSVKRSLTQVQLFPWELRLIAFPLNDVSYSTQTEANCCFMPHRARQPILCISVVNWTFCQRE